jgi:hypothetical protein
MPQTAVDPYCVLESWDTASRAWVPTPPAHPSIGAATAAAQERGIYGVVVVYGDRRVEIEPFAIV